MLPGLDVAMNQASRVRVLQTVERTAAVVNSRAQRDGIRLNVSSSDFKGDCPVPANNSIHHVMRRRASRRQNAVDDVRMIQLVPAAPRLIWKALEGKCGIWE